MGVERGLQNPDWRFKKECEKIKIVMTNDSSKNLLHNEK